MHAPLVHYCIGVERFVLSSRTFLGGPFIHTGTPHFLPSICCFFPEKVGRYPLIFIGAARSTRKMNFDDLKTPGQTIGWDFIVLMSRQGKIRLAEFFSSYTESDKRRILRDIAADVLPRAPKMCNIIEKGEHKFVYRRYASLYFVVGVPSEGTNELIVLEQIHLFVEVSYFVGREVQPRLILLGYGWLVTVSVATWSDIIVMN